MSLETIKAVLKESKTHNTEKRAFLARRNTDIRRACNVAHFVNEQTVSARKIDTAPNVVRINTEHAKLCWDIQHIVESGQF